MEGLTKHKAWDLIVDQCHQEEFTIKGPDDNDLKVIMIKSKANKDAKDLPLYIHWHGGAAYSGNPKLEIPALSRLALENNMCCVSMGYRLMA